MKINKWTMGLAAVGLVSIPSAGLAEEKLNPVLTSLTPTVIDGYVNVSAIWNPGTGNSRVPTYAFGAGKQDGFNLDVVKLSLSKALDESQWSAGYKVDLLFGPDANALATGSAAGIDVGGPEDLAVNNKSDFAIKQAYVAVRAPVGNGIDFKVGVWDTIIGYETFDAGSNPNYTRSYGYTIEPTTHTGILASYQICKFASISAGVANTFGPMINQRANGPKAESYKTYMAAAALTAPDDWGFLAGSTLYGGFINGFNSLGGGVDQVSYYAGVTLNTPIKALKVGFAFDYAGITDEGIVSDPGDGYETVYANAIAGYLSFQATEKLSLHGRVEYATTDTGLLDNSGAVANPYTSRVVALTGTVQYDLWKNVLSRLEVRWDKQVGSGDMLGYGGNLAKDSSVPGSGAGADKREYVTVALNLIYKF